MVNGTTCTTDLAHCLVKQARVHYGVHSGRIHRSNFASGHSVLRQLHHSATLPRETTSPFGHSAHRSYITMHLGRTSMWILPEWTPYWTLACFTRQWAKSVIPKAKDNGCENHKLPSLYLLVLPSMCNKCMTLSVLETSLLCREVMTP